MLFVEPSLASSASTKVELRLDANRVTQAGHAPKAVLKDSPS
jgi:hypothetical protein